MEKKPEISQGVNHVKVWCEDITGMGLVGAKAPVQMLAWRTRKRPKVHEVRSERKLWEIRHMTAGLKSHWVLWAW